MAIIIKFKVQGKDVKRVADVMDAEDAPAHDMIIRRVGDGKCEIEIRAKETRIYEYYRKAVEILRYG